jgi:hypothetical protein
MNFARNVFSTTSPETRVAVQNRAAGYLKRVAPLGLAPERPGGGGRAEVQVRCFPASCLGARRPVWYLYVGAVGSPGVVVVGGVWLTLR